MARRSHSRNASENRVQVTADSISPSGNLQIPDKAQGIVLFAHGSGSSRLSPRNQFVAEVLQEGGLATLLMDLLTPKEEAVDRWGGKLRFDIDLLTERLVGATDWLKQHPATKSLNVGYFGASTGAAAALKAGAQRPSGVLAIVSRGGRPCQATAELPRVMSPTLLIAGGADPLVIELNRQAMRLLAAEKKLEIVPGAGHLFEEPGALEAVAGLARTAHAFTRPAHQISQYFTLCVLVSCAHSPCLMSLDCR
jgi:putative phosphoribosyl transferase